MVDIDPDALNIALYNINSLNITNIQLINANVFDLSPSFFKKFDVKHILNIDNIDSIN